MIQKHIIYYEKISDHPDVLFNKAGLLPIFQLYMHICLIAHNVFHSSDGIAPSPLATLSLPIPQATTTAGERQASYQVSKAWNSLPPSRRLMESRNEKFELN